MIGTQSEISDIIAAVSLTFGLVLLPTLLNHRAFVPRWSSALTAAGLFVIGLCFFDLSLWWAAVSEMFSALVWLTIFVWRGKATNASEEDAH